jgi:hypothetical protein
MKELIKELKWWEMGMNLKESDRESLQAIIDKMNKQLTLTDVSHRRELFTDLLIWHKYNVSKDTIKTCEELAEEYINL